MTDFLFLFSGLDKLSENFRDVFVDKETCDATLKVMDKKYRVHRSVLIGQSSVFAAIFKHGTLQKQTGVITISDCDPDTFQVFLEYLYSGKVEELSFRSAKTLYYTSDKYYVEGLKTLCVEYLMKCLTVENVCEVAVFADKHDETQLYNKVLEFFIKNCFKILFTSEWEYLLKNDYRLANNLLRAMAEVKLKE